MLSLQNHQDFYILVELVHQCGRIIHLRGSVSTFPTIYHFLVSLGKSEVVVIDDIEHYNVIKLLTDNETHIKKFSKYLIGLFSTLKQNYHAN